MKTLEGPEWLRTLFFHMVSGLGLQFSYEEDGFKTMVSYRNNLPVKNNGFKTMFFMFFTWPYKALMGLIRPLRTFSGP